MSPPIVNDDKAVKPKLFPLYEQYKKQADQQDQHHYQHQHSYHDQPCGHAHEKEEKEELEERELEEKALQKVIRAYRNYRTHSLKANDKRRLDWNKLNKKQQNLTLAYKERVDSVDHLIAENASFISMLLESTVENDQEETMTSPTSSTSIKEAETDKVTDSDMEKVRSTLRQFVRDWSADGIPEREATYTPILNAINSYYGSLSVPERGKIQILVPGAGLGRLAFDIARQGYSCQGNEFSFYMLIASNFILNNVSKSNAHVLYPWIHSFSNTPSGKDHGRAVQVPDVTPGGLLRTCDFSMVAGDFLEVYKDEEMRGAWDVVVTCYFIDTAKNIVEYLEVIYEALKPGGIWINLGPLLYHFEGMRKESSIDLSLEEVKSVSRSLGFVFESEEMMPSTYTGNSNAMLKYIYNCAFWTARKPAN